MLFRLNNRLRQINRTLSRMQRPTACFLFVAGVFAAAPVLAEEGLRPRMAGDAICAGFGPGYVPAGAPGHCIKVQERLRVEPHSRRGLSPLDGGAAYAPMPYAEDGAMPAHLRLNGGFGRADIR
jgi:hypothetical protein